MKMPASTNARWKWAAEKNQSEPRNTNISSIKRVTRECLEVSRFRAFLSGGGGHQVGEVTRLGGVNRQSI